jgi:hypothetical protein
MWQLLQDEGCLEDAEIALRTTHVHLQASVTSRGENYSLCHGLGGNANVLVSCASVIDEPTITDRGLTDGMIEAAIAAYGADPKMWPCGIPGRTPDLMLGLAGMGHFLLQLHDGSTPTALLPAAWTA